MVRELSSKISFCLYVSFVAISLASCEAYEEPYLVSINEIQVSEVNIKRIALEAHLQIHNPNNVSLDLSRTELFISSDELILAQLDQTHDIAMPASSDFDLPISIVIDIAQAFDGDIMKGLSFGNQILSDRQIEILVEGHIYAGKNQVKLKVPIKRIETIKF